MQTLECVERAWERMGAFSKLGRLDSIIPYGIVWYDIYISKHKYKESFGTSRSVLERLETFGKR